MIRVHSLHKRYGHHEVLAGVDLTVSAGEQVAIIGPSGCGKSTLLRILGTLIEPDAGQVELGGQDVFALPEAERMNIRAQFGMVFQHSALFDSLTVAENVGFFLTERLKMPWPEVQKKVSETLVLVGLGGKEYLMPSELSGGMQKRVSFARAIVHRPKVLLCDEPTTGLDPLLSTSIENLMCDLSTQLAITLVIVTHQISTVLRAARRVLYLENGVLLEVGSPHEALHSSNETVRNFMAGALA